MRLVILCVSFPVVSHQLQVLVVHAPLQRAVLRSRNPCDRSDLSRRVLDDVQSVLIVRFTSIYNLAAVPACNCLTILLLKSSIPVYVPNVTK